MKRRFEYKVLSTPDLPPGKRLTPIMSNEEMEDWLNTMDETGWEFMGFGQKRWTGPESYFQTWWIFRRPSQ